MKLLSKLTPAETKMLLDSSIPIHKDLLKLTLMDLLLKKVLQIKEVKKADRGRVKRVRVYKYVIKGKNFDNYKYKHHENIFLKPFRGKSIKILFRHLIKIAYDETPSDYDIKKILIKEPLMKPYIKTSALLRIIGKWNLNEAGQRISKEIKTYLDSINQNIGDWLKNDQDKALTVLMEIGGNIFLLENIDFALFASIDKEIVQRHKAEYQDKGEYYDDWIFYSFYFDDLDTHNFEWNDFDDTFDTFDSDYDSAGCSSCDSGCSGCGGCGGCD